MAVMIEKGPPGVLVLRVGNKSNMARAAIFELLCGAVVLLVCMHFKATRFAMAAIRINVGHNS